MRIVHVIRNLHDGGMERIVADLVAALAGLGGLEVHVLSLEPGGRFAGLLEGRAEVHVAHTGSRLAMLRPATLAGDLARLRPDIVHAHSGTWFKTARAARMGGTRAVVYTEHGRHHPDPLGHRLVDAAAARMTDRVVAVSGALRDELIERVLVPARAVHVIVNGIDVDAAARAPARPDLLPLVPTRPFTFVTLGRIEPVKGLEQLVRVMARWPAGAPPCRVVHAGDGSERARLERDARAAGVADRFSFLGWVDDPVGLLKAADAYLLPSYSEGTSISLLEAMACGCPPIASAVGGNPEVLGDALSDWLVPSGDADALGKRMLLLAASPELRGELGKAARERVRSSYSLDAMARSYAQLYRAMFPAPGTVNA